MSAPRVTKHITIVAPEDAHGRVRIAVVADTHSAPHPRTIERLGALAPLAILHAGDIGSLTVLDALAAVAPVHAVRGNIDERAEEVPDALVIDVVAPAIASARLLTRILMVHIAVYGPKLRADVARLARSEDVSIVVCGHSHVPFIAVDRGLPVFNPGSVGPRRGHLPILFGTIDIAPDGIHLAHVDCATGAAWRP